MYKTSEDYGIVLKTLRNIVLLCMVKYIFLHFNKGGMVHNYLKSKHMGPSKNIPPGVDKSRFPVK